MSAQVSVIIPAYNARETLDRALDSVAAQRQWIKETLVIDDESTDDTFEIAQRRDWVTVIRQPHSGAAAARNRGLKVATGSIIAFLDTDDEWAPEKLAEHTKIFELHPDVSFVSSDFVVVALDGVRSRGFDKHRTIYDLPAVIEGETRFLQGGVFEGLCRGLFTATPTVTFRRALLEQVGYFDADFQVAEDFDFYLRLARAARFAVIDKPLARVNYKSASLGSDSSLVLQETYRMLSSFEHRNGSLSASERAAVNRKTAQVLLSLGYQSNRNGKLSQALRHYTKAFRIAPGWYPLKYAIRAIGSVLIPLRG